MLYSAFIIGFLGSFHCLGMCGPIAFLLPYNRNNKILMLIEVLVYNFSRLISYSVIGLVFGYFGKFVSFFGFQQQFSIITGLVLMSSIIFYKIKIFSFLSNFVTNVLFRFKNKFNYFLKNKSFYSFFLIGFLNGFLPCGLVYVAVLSSIVTFNPIHGALFMIFFGIGTIPLMVISVYFFDFRLKSSLVKLIPFLVFILGLILVLRGLGLGIPFLSPDINLTVDSVNCH